MDWLSRLVQLKKLAGKTNEEIATAAGIPKSTVEKVFMGYTKNPQADTLFAILHSMGYQLSDLDPQANTTNSATPEEMLHLKQFRSLDSYGQTMVLTVLKTEASRCQAQSQNQTSGNTTSFPFAAHGTLPDEYTPAAKRDLDRMQALEKELLNKEDD